MNNLNLTERGKAIKKKAESKTKEDNRTRTETGTSFINDRLYDEYSSICNSKFKAWYMKVFYYMPEEEVHRLADIAMKYRNQEQQKRVFSKLLKNWKSKYI